jgi:calcium-dependent protein kinase
MRIRYVTGIYFKIIIRDIKPENFLLFSENEISCIKLIDFGLSKKLNEDELMNTPNGTVSRPINLLKPYYIAPEVLKGNYTNQCDIWSMGVVLYIMLCGKPPFGGPNNTEILKNVVKG